MTPTEHVIGFDVSLSSTGWAVLDYEQGDLVRCGIIRTSPKLELAERLNAIYGDAYDLIATFRGDVAIEEGISHRSGEVTRKLAAAWGVVSLAAFRANACPPMSVNVSEAKTTAGARTKDGIVATAALRWPNIVRQHDICDAAFIAETARRQIQKHYDDGDFGDFGDFGGDAA